MVAQTAGAEPAAPPASPPEAAAPPAPKPPPPPAPAMPPGVALNPKSYGPGVVCGAQAEFIGAVSGISAVLVGYDAVWMQIEGSVGIAWIDDESVDQDTRDRYSLSLRAAVPVHRGSRSDFALLGGGGAEIDYLPGGDIETGWFVTFGARIRVFMTRNVATVATLGALLAVSPDAKVLLAGARPLGAAGVVYYFR